MAPRTGTADGPTSEIGSATGQWGQVAWSAWAGGDDIEHVPDLQWPNSVITYTRMRNDAQVNSLYLGATLPIRSYRYFLNPNGARPEVVERISRNYNLPIGRQEFDPETGQAMDFQRRRAQRRFSFHAHLEDALRAIQYGHMFFEQVGEVDMAEDRLEWNLRKLGIRAPRTINEINVADDGGLESIRQAQGMNNPPIPVSRLVAYVWDREGANWVGRSMLRSIYKNYLVKDRVLRVGAINIERAGGVPFIEAGPEATPEQIRQLDALARRFRVGEGAGAALPHGAQLKFAAAAGGDGAVNYIKLQNEEMGRAWLQMFSALGQSSSGSGGALALGEALIDYFATAQETIAQWFCDTFNEHVIEDDVEWNEGPDEEYAPLVEFETAMAMDPMMALQEAVGEDDGLDVNEGGEVEAMLGLRASRGSRYRRAARRARVAQREVRAGSGGDGLSSPVGRPARPVTASATQQNTTEAREDIVAWVPAHGIVAGRAIRAEREVTFEPLKEEPLLSTVRNIEVCAVGIEYPLASGPATFTPEDLQAAVASQEDPAIVNPRVWLGHPDDDRFHAGRATPAGSAEPALGKLINMRVEDSGMTLVADAVGVPTWLARILSSAYPSRSIEGFQGAETVTGHKWDLVITDLALLGVTWPGVSTLDDLESLYSEDGPEGVVVKEADELTVAAARGITAAVNVDDVRREFYGNLPKGHEWAWIRAIFVEPDELIVDDDDSGELFRVPYTIGSDDSISFGEWTSVKVEYVNASALRESAEVRAVAAAMLRQDVDHKVVIYANKEESALVSSDKETENMPPELLAQLREQYGLTAEQLPDGSDPQQVAAAIGGKEPVPGPVSPDPEGKSTENGGGGDPANPDPVTVAGSREVVAETDTSKKDETKETTNVPDGMVAVPAEQWQAMQSAVQSLSASAQQDRTTQDLKDLDDAIKAGKLPPSGREVYAERLKDPKTRDAYHDLLTQPVEKGGLMAGLVPVEARGSDPSDQQLAADAEAYPASWLPEVAQRDAANVAIVQEA